MLTTYKNGGEWTNSFKDEVSRLVANPSVCRVYYHWFTSVEDKIAMDRDIGFALYDVKKIEVLTREELFNSDNAAMGRVWTAKVEPPVYLVVVHRPAHVENHFVFLDQDLAKGVAKALAHAVDLCGGMDVVWQQAYDFAKKAFAEHRYPDADKAYQAALAQAENFDPGDPRLSATLYGLGIDYYVERRYEEAEPLLLRVVELREVTAKPDSDLVKALLQLAELYRATHHLRKAESLYRKALVFSKDLPSADSVTTATIYLDLGLMYAEQDLLKDAETAYVQAIAKFQNAEGSARTGLGFSNLNLAQIYEAQNKFVEAEPLYQRAIAAFEEASGPNSANLANALDSYAGLLKKMDRKAEASKAKKQADQIRRKSGS